MTAPRLVFGLTDPREVVVPADECLSCRHPAEAHVRCCDNPRHNGCDHDACPCPNARCTSCRGIREECDCEEGA